jgi:hypothetical protein
VLEQTKIPYSDPVLDDDKIHISRTWFSYFQAWANQIIAGVLRSVTGTAGRVLVTGTPTDPIINIDPAYVASAVQGGTGQTSYLLGDTLYASGSLALSKLPGTIATSRHFLAQTGTGAVSAAPLWDTPVSALASIPGRMIRGTTTGDIAAVGGQIILQDGDNFAAVIAALGSVVSASVSICGQMTVTTNLTIPSNISIVVLKGGSFAISSGVTLRIHGAFDAGPYTVFAGSGSVFLTKAKHLLPEWFGGAADGIRVSDLVTTASVSAVSSASALFTSAMVGMPIVVDRAGASNAQLITTIASYVSATSVTLTVAPSVSRTTVAHWGTDNTAAFQKAVDSGYLIPDYNVQCNVDFGYGIYMMAGVVYIRNKIFTFRPHANGTVIKMIGVGTAPQVVGHSANVFSGFVCHNVQPTVKGFLFEGAGSNGGGVVTSVDYNFGFVFGENGGAVTGATKAIIHENEFRFFSKVILFRGVNYVVTIDDNYFQWNEDCIHVGEDAGFAEGSIVITGTNGTIIPSGARFQFTDLYGIRYYNTVEAVTIAGGVASVVVEPMAAGARSDRAAGAVLGITATWPPADPPPAWVAGVSAVAVDSEGMSRNEPDANVHFTVADTNCFAENTRDIQFEHASQFKAGGDWENNFWPPSETYVNTTSNSVYSIFFDYTTRTCEAGPMRGIRPVGMILRSSEGLLVNDVIMESFYRNYGIRIDNPDAIGTRVANTFVWAKINHTNDYGGIGTGVVGGIYSECDVDYDNVTTLACSVGIDALGKGSKFNGVTILDPYKSQSGRTHTGDGIGVRWSNCGTKAFAHGVRVMSTGISWSGKGVILSEKAFSSTGTATADIYVVDPLIELTGVTDPFGATGGKLIVLGYEVAGTPEGVISCSPGSLIRRTDPTQNGGIYQKLSGNGNTGYAASISTDNNGDAGILRNLIIGQLAPLTNPDAINLAGSAAKALGIVNTGNGAADAIFGSLGWGRVTQAASGMRVGIKALRKTTNYTTDGNIGLYGGAYASDDADGDGSLVFTWKNNTGLSVVNGNLRVDSLGRGVQIKSGTNARVNMGNVLVLGTVIVGNTSVTANTVITWNRVVSGGTLGNITITRAAGTGYTITSDSATETSTIDVMLTEAT